MSKKLTPELEKLKEEYDFLHKKHTKNLIIR